jgi:hypothetical protein
VLALKGFHGLLQPLIVEIVAPRAALHAKPLADQTNVRMLAARLERRTVRQTRVCRRSRLHLSRGRACLQESLAEPHELLVRWMQRLEIPGRRVTRGNGLHNRSRITQGWLLIQVAADRGGIDPPAARVARVFQHGHAQLDLGFRQRGRRLLP